MAAPCEHFPAAVSTPAVEEAHRAVAAELQSTPTYLCSVCTPDHIGGGASWAVAFPPEQPS